MRLPSGVGGLFFCVGLFVLSALLHCGPVGAARPTPVPGSVTFTARQIAGGLNPSPFSVANFHGAGMTTAGWAYTWGLAGEWLGSGVTGTGTTGTPSTKNNIAGPKTLACAYENNGCRLWLPNALPWTNCLDPTGWSANEPFLVSYQRNADAGFSTVLKSCKTYGSNADNLPTLQGYLQTITDPNSGNAQVTALQVVTMSAYSGGADVKAMQSIARGGAASITMTKLVSTSNTGVQNSDPTLLASTLTLLSNGRVVAVGTCQQGECGVGGSGSPVASLTTGRYDTSANLFRHDGASSSTSPLTVVQVALACMHSCVLLNTGDVRCTGDTTRGQIGVASVYAARGTAANIFAVPSGVNMAWTTLLQAKHPAPFNTWTIAAAQVAVGIQATCVLLNTGFVTCFGTQSPSGTLAGNTASSESVISVPTHLASLPAGIPAVSISMGQKHRCALMANGSAYCWGDNSLRQLASVTAGTSTSIATPTLVTTNAGKTVVQIMCGAQHTCILQSDSTVLCAGDNTWGQIHSGISTANPVPPSVTMNTLSGSALGTGTTILQLGGGSTAFATCFRYGSAATIIGGSGASASSWKCVGASYAIGANRGSESNTDHLPVASPVGPVVMSAMNSVAADANFMTNSVDGFADYSVWPVTGGISLNAGGLSAIGGPTTDLRVSYWLPYDRSNGAPGFKVFFDNSACNVAGNLGASTLICTMDAAALQGITRTPPLVTLTWTGAAGNPAWGIYACPRPIVTSVSAAITYPATTSTSVSVTLTGVCFNNAAAPWSTGTSVITSASSISGAVAASVAVVSPTTVTVTVGSGVGNQTFYVVASGVTWPILYSLPAFNISYPPPFMTTFAGVRGSQTFVIPGVVNYIFGRNFGAPGLAPVSVRVGGTLWPGAVVVNDSAISVVTPAFVFTPQTLTVVIAGADLTTVPTTLQVVSPAATFSYLSISNGIVNGVYLASNLGETAYIWGTNFRYYASSPAVTLFGTSLVANVLNDTTIAIAIPVFSGSFMPSPLTARVPASWPSDVISAGNINISYPLPYMTTFWGLNGSSTLVLTGVINYILGKNFGAAGIAPVSVQVGGVAWPSAVVVNDSAISVVTPPGAFFSPRTLLLSVGGTSVSTIPTNLQVSFPIPTYSYLSISNGIFNGVFLASGKGETAHIWGTNFRYYASSLNLTLSGASLVASVLNDTTIALAIPVFRGSYIPAGLVVSIPHPIFTLIPAGLISISYVRPIIASIVPNFAFAASGLRAGKTFAITGSGLGDQASDLLFVSLGRSNCTSAVWVSSTTITCIMSSAAMAAVDASGLVIVTTVGYQANPPSAVLLTVLPAPAISLVLANSPAADPLAPLWLNGISLGYGNSTVRNATGAPGGPGVVGNDNAPIINAVSLVNGLSGAVVNCSSVFYPTLLGGALGCLPPSNIAAGVPFFPRVSISTLDNITVNGPIVRFGFSPTLSPVVSTVRGGNVIASAGETVSITGSGFGPGGSGWVISVALNGVNISAASGGSYSLVNDALITVQLPPFSFVGSASVVLTVTTVGGFVSGGVAMSYAVPIVSSISPNASYARTGSLLGRNFTIGGTGFGLIAADVMSASIGLAPCVPLFRVSASSLVCRLSPAAMLALSSPAVLVPTSILVSVTLAGGATAVNSSIFVNFGSPQITGSFVNAPGDMLAVTLIQGLALGHGSTLGPTANVTIANPNAAVLSGAGFMNVNGTYPCAQLDFPLTLGLSVLCTPNASLVDTVTTYTPYVVLEDNITVYGATVDFRPATTSLSVSWSTADFAPSALPSSTSSTFIASPLPTLLVTTPTGSTPAASVTCLASLVATNTPPGSTINALLVGNASTTGLSTTSFAFSVGIVGGSNWNYSIAAQCSYGGLGPWFSPPAPLRIRVATLAARWNISAPNTSFVSLAPSALYPSGIVVPFAPAPSLTLFASSGGGSGWAPAGMSAAVGASPSVRCAVIPAAVVPGTIVSGAGSLSANLAPSTAAATWSNLGASGALGTAFALNASCVWISGEVLPTATSNVSSIAPIVATWASPAQSPQSTFLYNTPTNASRALLSIFSSATASFVPLTTSAVGGTLAPGDVSCSMSAALLPGGTPVTYLGGAIGAFNPSDGTFSIAPMSYLPLYLQVVGAVFVRTTLQCSVRGQPLAPLSFSSGMQNLTVTWTAPTPISLTGSSLSTTIAAPAVSFAMSDAVSGAVIASDSSASCTLSIASARTAAGATATASLGSVPTTTLSAGLGSFSTWAVASAPLQSTLTLSVVCVRANGGPSPRSTFNVTVRGARVAWAPTSDQQTLNASHSRILVPYDIASTVSASLQILNTTSASNPLLFDVQPYAAAAYPPASCTLSIDESVSAAAGATLNGVPILYQSQPVAPVGGAISFSVRLAAVPGYAVPLELVCAYGDRYVTSSTPLILEVASVFASWSTPPPSLFTYNTLTAPFSLLFSIGTPVATLPLTTNTTAAPSDISCTTSAFLNSSLSTSVSFSGGAAAATGLDSLNSTLSFGGVQLSPSNPVPGTAVALFVSCTFRKLLVISAVTSVTAQQTLSLAWISPPPTSIVATTSTQTFLQSPLQLQLLDQSGALLPDSTSLCKLSVTATSSSGSKVSGISIGPTTSINAQALGGIVEFQSWWAIAPIATVLHLTATCLRLQGGPPLLNYANTTTFGAGVDFYYAATLSPTYAAGPVLLYGTSSVVTLRILVRNATSSGSTSFFSLANYNSSLYPSSLCSLAIDTSTPASAKAVLSGSPQIYSKQLVDANGFVSFEVALNAAAEMPIYLRATCTFGDNSIKSSLLTATLATVVAVWNTLPPPFFLYSTQTAPSSFTLFARIPPVNGTLGALISTSAAGIASNALSCAMSAFYAIGGAPAPFSAGQAGSVDSTSGQVAVTGFIVAPAATVPAGVVVSVKAACTFKTYNPVPPLIANMTMDTINITWIVPPPFSALPSAQGSTNALPSFSLGIYSGTGGLIASDSSTLCTVKLSSARDKTGAPFNQASVGGVVSATASNGIVTFSAVAIFAPPSSSVNLSFACTRTQNSASLTLTLPQPASVAMYGFNTSVSAISSVNASARVPIVLFGATTNVSVLVRQMIWSSATTWGSPFNASFTLAPFDATTLATTCTASVSPAATVAVSLGGVISGVTSSFTNVPVATTGAVTLSFRVTTNSPGSALPLRVVCTVGGTPQPPLFFNVIIAPLFLQPITGRSIPGGGPYAAPPSLFTFGTLLPSATFQLWANLSMSGLGNVPVPRSYLSTEDLLCSPSAVVAPGSNGGATVPLGAGAVVFSSSPGSNYTLDGTVVLSGARPQPPFASIVGSVQAVFQASCTYRTQTVRPGTFTASMEVQSLSLDTPPPASICRTTQGLPTYSFLMSTFNVSLRDAFNAVVVSDSAGTCAATVTGGYYASGAPVSAAQYTLAINGVSASLAAMIFVKGVASFPNATLSGPLMTVATIQIKCKPGIAGSPTVSVSTSVAIQSAAVAWANAIPSLNLGAPAGGPNGPPVSVFFDTPSPINVSLSLLRPVSRSNASIGTTTPYVSTAAPPIRCTLSPGSPAVTLGGSTTAYTKVTSSTSGSTLAFSVRVKAPARTVVPLLLTCFLGDAALPTITIGASVSGINAAFSAPWPSLIVPSTSVLAQQYPLFPLNSPPTIVLTDDFGSPMTPDSIGTTCTLVPLVVGRQVAPSVPSLTNFTTTQSNAFAVGFIVAIGDTSPSSFDVPASGIATLPTAVLSVPAGMMVNFTLTCSRLSSGGISAASRTFTSAVASFLAAFTAGNEPPSSALYNEVNIVQIQAQIQTTLSSTWDYVPFVDPAAQTTCTVEVSDANVATRPVATTLSGTSKYQRSPRGDGLQSIPMQIMGAPNAIANINYFCSVQGSKIVGSGIYSTVVLALATSLTGAGGGATPATLPIVTWPFSAYHDTAIKPPPAVRVDPQGSAPFSDAKAALFGCLVVYNVSLAASLSVNFNNKTYDALLVKTNFDSVEVTYPGYYQFDPALGAIPLSKVRLSAWWGTTFPAFVNCFRPGQSGDNIADIPLTLRIPAVSLAFAVAPPAIIAAKQAIDFSALVLNLDAGGIPNVADNTTDCAISNAAGVTMVSNTGAASRGLIPFTSFQLLGTIGTNYSITITCKFGLVPLPTSLVAHILISGCLPGQQPLASGLTCTPCASGTYSDGGSGACIVCPFGVSCLAGLVAVQTGFFLALSPDMVANPSAFNLTISADGTRFSPTILATTELHPCFNAESCVVNATERSYGCATGYTGVLCGVCDEASNFVMEGQFCVPCAADSVNKSILALGLISSLVVLVYLALFMNFSSRSESKVVWRIAVNYLSVLAAFEMFEANGTNAFVNVFHYVQSIVAPGSGVGLNVSPIQCVFNLSFYFRFAVIISLPLLLAAMAFAVNLVVIAVRHAVAGWDAILLEIKALLAGGKLLAIAFFVLFMSYPILSREAFKMLRCTSYTISGHRYLLADLSVKCDSYAHNLGALMAYLVLGLVSVGLPLLFSWYLVNNEGEVRLGPNSPFFAKLGFLYQGYRTEAWYEYTWESGAMLRKTMIVGIASLSSDAVYQTAMAVMVLVAYFGAQLHFKPYNKVAFNILEGLTLIVLVLTQVVSLMYLRTKGLVIAASTDSLYSPGIISQAQQNIVANPGMLTASNTTAVLLIANTGTFLLLVFYFFYVKRHEAASLTCCGCLLSFFDCGAEKINTGADEGVKVSASSLAAVEATLLKRGGLAPSTTLPKGSSNGLLAPSSAPTLSNPLASTPRNPASFLVSEPVIRTNPLASKAKASGPSVAAKTRAGAPPPPKAPRAGSTRGMTRIAMGLVHRSGVPTTSQAGQQAPSAPREPGSRSLVAPAPPLPPSLLETHELAML